MMSENHADSKNKPDKILITIAIIVTVVVSIVIFALITVANPFEARKRQLDRTKIDDFYNIGYKIDEYYKKHKQLPSGFSDVDFFNEHDTKARIELWHYEYKLINDKKYKLCTTFETSTYDNENAAQDQKYYAYEREKHHAGYDCIEKEVDIPRSNE